MAESLDAVSAGGHVRFETLRAWRAGNPARAREATSPGRSWALAAMVAILGAAVASNAWWLVRYRRGLPYDIDEAGYLLRAVRYSQALHGQGLLGFYHEWTRPDIIGPILPAFAGIVRYFTGASLFAMLELQQVFYALTIVAAYLLARRFTGYLWSVVTALVVACAPGVVASGHLFLLAEPAAALFTLTLVAQLAAGNFDRLGRALLWGLLAGLTTLTRSMMLALVVAPVGAAGLRVLAAGLDRRRVRNLAAGLAVGFLVALSWFYTSLRPVLEYLTKYGYGSDATKYGKSHSILSGAWWTSRLNDIVNESLYAPILGALVLCVVSYMLVVAARAWTGRRRTLAARRARGADGPTPTGVRRGAEALRRWMQADPATVVVTVAVAYLVLSTSANSGSYFELPLVPAIACLVALVANTPRAARFGIATAVAAACAVTAANQLNVFRRSGSGTSIQVGPFGIRLYNDTSADFSGPRIHGVDLGGVMWGDCGGATITCFYGRSTDITVPYVTSWERVNDEVESFLYSFAAAHDRTPVVFFAYQGPLFNTNTVALAAQLEHRALPVGALLQPRLQHHVSLVDQLELPAYGQPNFVIAGATARSSAPQPTGAGSSTPELARVAGLLHRDGFVPVRTVPIEAAHDLVIWWKDR